MFVQSKQQRNSMETMIKTTPSQKKIARFKRQYEKLLAKFPDIVVDFNMCNILIAYDVKGCWGDKVPLPNTHTVKSEN